MRILKYYRNALIWAFLILVLCLMPVKGIPAFHLLNLFSLDKFAHMGIFGIQFWLLATGQQKRNKLSGTTTNAGLMAFLFTVAYGGSVELMQGYAVAGRSMDIMDMVANTIGAALGWLVFYLRMRKR